MKKVAKCSFIHFVYPFLFDAAEFDERVKQFDSATCHSETKAKREVPVWTSLWKEKGFPRDDMLAYVASFLNPKDPEQATARIWKLNDALDEACGLAERADWQLVRKEKKETVIPFRFGEIGAGSNSVFAVQLALFRVGVGFLTVRARPVSDEVDDWLDFISNFRFVKGQRQYIVRATKRVRNDQTQQLEDVEFFPSLARNSLQRRERKSNNTHASANTYPTEATTSATKAKAEDKKTEKLFIHILDALLETGNFHSNGEHWWQDVFIPEQMMPFAVLYVDEAPADESVSLTETHEIDSQVSRPVVSPPDRRRQEDFLLLYKLRNFFSHRQGNNPAPEDLAPDHPSLIPYAERSWFIFSLDGGSFLICDAPQTDFFRRTMPDHLRDQYFLLLLIVLHQRFTLMSISHTVVTKWLTERDEEQRMEAFSHIRNRLLDFTTHGLFTQVMQREHHHRSYRKWQEIFQIKDLYEEVRDEVREIHDHLSLGIAKREEVTSRRIERIISVLGVAVGVPALTLGFLSVNIRGWTAADEGLTINDLIAVTLSSVGAGLILAALLQLLLRLIRSSGRK